MHVFYLSLSVLNKSQSSNLTEVKNWKVSCKQRLALLMHRGFSQARATLFFATER